MAIEDRFKDCYAGEAVPSPDWPLERFATVTKSDTVDLGWRPRALIVSADGTLKVTDRFGTVVSITVTKGVNWVRVDRVWSTGSDAITVVQAD